MIVLTAPTSNIGSQVLARLLDARQRVRVIARDPGKLAPEVRERVDVVVGSHSQPDVVEQALAGADSLFWLVPSDPRAVDARAAYLDFARPGCAAMRRHGIQHVVGISALGRGWPREAGHVTATLEMDDMIAATGVHYRALACASFMDNLLRQAQQIKEQGMFFWPMPGDVAVPFCATRDIAAAAAQLLCNRSWSGVDSIPIMGPEDLSFNEMAQTMSEVLGKPVRYQQTDMEAMRAMLIGRGTSPGMAQAMVDMLTAKNEGMDNMMQRTALSGSTHFRQWCEEVLKPAVQA